MTRTSSLLSAFEYEPPPIRFEPVPSDASRISPVVVSMTRTSSLLSAFEYEPPTPRTPRVVRSIENCVIDPVMINCAPSSWPTLAAVAGFVRPL